MADAPTFTFTPVAWIRSGYADRAEVPKGPDAVHSMEGEIEVREDLVEGLQDIEGFSHLFVIWVFDRSDPGYELLTTWLAKRPEDALFDAWEAYIKALASQLNDEQNRLLRAQIVGFAKMVATSAGGILGFGKVSGSEEKVLERIESAFAR